MWAAAITVRRRESTGVNRQCGLWCSGSSKPCTMQLAPWLEPAWNLQLLVFFWVPGETWRDLGKGKLVVPWDLYNQQPSRVSFYSDYLYLKCINFVHTYRVITMFKDMHFIYAYFARMQHNNAHAHTHAYRQMRHSGQDREKSGSWKHTVLYGCLVT